MTFCHKICEWILSTILKNQVPCITIFSNGGLLKNKKIPQTVCWRKKNSHNRPLKNKTIPKTVHRGINNFYKPSIASISNMSECLKMFKFIIAQSSNIQRPEHSYRWKYGTNNLKYDIILFQKTYKLVSEIRWHTRRKT